MTTDRPPGLALAELDTVELTVEKLVAGGDGLGRVDSVPVFVPRSAPGDRLLVRIVERKPDYGRGEILEILEPGPGRRKAPCPYFDRCGGCDLQHLEDRKQVELKAAAARETLRRIGGIELPSDTEIVAGSMWGYRLRTQLHTTTMDETVRVGYFARGSKELVPIRSCPILAPELEELLPELPARLGADPPRRLDLLSGEDGISCAPVTGDLPHGEVILSVGEFDYLLDARCFFQAHVGLVERLVEEAVGDWEGDEVADLYAGVGLFTLPLARRYRRVIAVEGDRIAARYGRKNLRRHRLGNARFETQAVESWVGEISGELDRVVVDPPRRGLPGEVREALLEAEPERITYVSCHPATLARDLEALVTGYGLESVRLLDLFPQSGHMEIVAQLSRRA
ncbi:MAG: class I SAM-dependent RNA methyltransferase [Thermoanaerobaculia bacterium]|nr:class I SAM-dependent RNA methyltransferase [Thermoanaerobaculia bacterium]